MPPSPEARFHQEWLGYLRPVGLVVAPPALVAAQCFPNRNVAPLQLQLRELVEQSDPPCILDFPGFCREILGWERGDLAGGPGGPELPRSLDVALSDGPPARLCYDRGPARAAVGHRCCKRPGCDNSCASPCGCWPRPSCSRPPASPCLPTRGSSCR